MAHYVLNAYLNSSSQIDILNLSSDVKRALRESQIKEGILTAFVTGSTACISLLENDAVVHEELKKLIASFVLDSKENRPQRKSKSGHLEAHLRAAFLARSITIPIHQGRLLLGPWQEVIVFDFDDKASRREVIIYILGEDEKKEQPRGR